MFIVEIIKIEKLRSNIYLPLSRLFIVASTNTKTSEIRDISKTFFQELEDFFFGDKMATSPKSQLGDRLHLQQKVLSEQHNYPYLLWMNI